jgi:hypothetical protein
MRVWVPACAGMTMFGAPVVNIVIPAQAGIHRPGSCYCLSRSDFRFSIFDFRFSIFDFPVSNFKFLISAF